MDIELADIRPKTTRVKQHLKQGEFTQACAAIKEHTLRIILYYDTATLTFTRPRVVLKVHTNKFQCFNLFFIAEQLFCL